MNERRNTRAGGVLLALGIAAGITFGSLAGQPRLGFLAGTAAGALLALLVYLHDRRG